MNWLDNYTIMIPLAGCIGLCFGSFITLLSYRLPLEMPVMTDRSQCPHCKTKLGVLALIPLISFLVAGAKCRYCSAKLSWRYPLIELVSGVMFVGVLLLYGPTAEALIIAGLCVCILTLIVTDFEHYIIPDELQIAMAALAIVYAIHMERQLDDLFIAAIVGGGLGMALLYGFRHVRKKEGLGWGDVKFFAVAGLWLGLKPMVPFFFYAGLLGVITAGGWRLVHKGERFPFGPALAVSMLICILFPQVPGWFWNIGR